MRRLLNLLYTLIAIGVIGAAGVAYYLYASFTGPGPLTEDKTLVIPKGTGVLEIAGILKTENVIADVRIFSLGVKLFSNHKPLIAGEYVFPKGVSPSSATGILIAGKSITHRLTIPEGLTVREVLELVSSEPLLDGPLPVDRPPEGSLLPETYTFLRGESRVSIVQRMRDAMTKTLADEWTKRDPAIALKTPEEAVTMASLVEKETSQDDERARVAAVFYNRMKKGMPLQSDPTVIYGLGAAYDGSLHKVDLQTDTPYNSYTRPGLPPTPIALPGLAALQAALHPTPSKALYFVSRGDGTSVFSETLNAHNAAVNQYIRGGHK